MPQTREFRRGDDVIVVTETGDHAGPPVVLVHGIGMGRKYWSELAKELGREARVLAIDLPGFGDAPDADRPLTMEDFGALVGEFVEAEGIAPATLVGHSMGAQVVAETAAQRPDVVASLVLIAPTVNPRERSIVLQAIRFLQDEATRKPKVVGYAIRLYLQAGLRWYAQHLRLMIAHRVERILPAVVAPTLVVRGEQDRVAPRAWAREVARQVQDGRYAEIADRGHDAFLTEGQDVAHLVAAHARAEEVGNRVGKAALPEPPPGVAAAWWWARDYVYAGHRQAAALLPPWSLAPGTPRRPPRGWSKGEPGRPEVVLLPGIYEHWTFLKPLGDALNAAGYRVVVVHGMGTNRRGVAETSARLRRALAKARRPAAGRVIVAHSKGGLIGKHLLIQGEGDADASSADELGVRGVVAISTPFAGSRRARLLIDPSVRALMPSDETIVLLGRSSSVNSRIVSIFGPWDPHIPDGSVLEGATNVRVPVPGHFRPLGAPETHRAVLDAIAMLSGPSTSGATPGEALAVLNDGERRTTPIDPAPTETESVTSRTSRESRPKPAPG